jgi:FMN phosphatase YigB (HAD superfamily)
MNGLVCTFDFDDTLASMTEEKQGLLWGIVSDELVPIKDVIDILMEKHKEGYEIHIVTAREEWAIPEVKGFIDNYQLPIKEIHHTSGGSKLPILKKIKSVLHVDDILHHVIAAELEGIPCLLVDDGRHKNNCTADQFNKILI